MHPYIDHVNPNLGELLTKIRLDKCFVRGQGCYLYDQEGNTYLDLIAAYGALPFGFNPPEIWEAIRQVEASQEPSFVQPSLLTPAGQLAKSLLAVAPGMGKVTFANSGAEAVEAAIKLARSKAGKQGIISTINSFHGKTLGALSATGNASYQRAFGAPVEGFRFVPYGDIDSLKQLLEAEAQEIAAVILEPIQGEGGIVEPPPGYLTQVRDLCTRYEVLLIFDEIQTGLGRTGLLFASQAEGVIPDIMTIAKALGGGLVPIGAMLCTDEVYTEEFAAKHSSTFAGNTIACRVGLRVLELLTKDEQWLVREVARKGERFKEGLETIQAKYPQIIKGVRGRGLMLGLDFGSTKAPYPDSMLGIMAEQKGLTPIIASHLLNVGRVRVAPTLNGASVIRIEPPLVITDQQIDYALEAIERTTAVLALRNTAALTRHLVPGDVKLDFDGGKDSESADLQLPPAPQAHNRDLSADGDGRFAFIIHPLNLQNYAEYDQSLKAFTHEQLLDLAERWTDLLDPFVLSTVRITSPTGSSATGDFIVVPYTAAELVEMPREKAEAKIIPAVELAEERGARIVGLGAYTSVVTGGGRSLLRHVSVPLTTGNSFTVTSGVDALLIGAEKLGLTLNETTAAIVGAGGAIGKASALLLAERVSRLVLIGNPQRPEKNRLRMLRVLAEMYRYLREQRARGVTYASGSIGAYVNSLSDLPSVDDPLNDWISCVEDELKRPNSPVTITVDLRQNLPQADLILAATSSTEALITPDIIKAGALICDMSRPGNVSAEVLEKRPDVLVIDGGVIELPGKPDLGWNFGFDKGLAYACMSETMILALEKIYANTSIGADLNLEYMNQLKEYAAAHGFKLAGFRSFDLPLPVSVWERVVAARKSIVNSTEPVSI